MLTLILVPLILVAVALSLIVRILRSFIHPYHLRRPYYGPYGFNGHGHCYRGHWFPGRGLLSILFLVALERLFDRRW